jgi:PAS domain S-box-containing protein
VNPEHITAVLYDMALVVGGEVTLRPLLVKTLQRLMYHTSFPVGMVLLGGARPGLREDEVELRLELAIGDYELSAHAGGDLLLPRGLVVGPAGLAHDPALLAHVPRAGSLPYAVYLRLPVDDEGVIVLLTHRASRAALPLDRIFQPVMANLARAMTLCRHHEAYTAGLLAERDAARIGLERFRAAIDTSADVIAVVDAMTGRFVDFNRTAEKVLGYARAELLALCAADVVPDLERERERALDGLARGGDRRDSTFEALHHRKDGSTFPAEVRLTAFSSHGEPPLLIAVSRDVTARKAIEQQLQQSQKLESIARLAGGVAHDFNNVLTAILGGVDVLLERVPEGDPLREGVQEIEDAARRAAGLTRQLLVFSRKEIVQPVLVDLNDVVAGMARMLRRLIGEDIELVSAPAAGLGRVRADPGQLEQVIVNLAVNARDAMVGGGRLAIETGSAHVDEELARLQEVAPGRHVVLSVSDTGCGMSGETQAHLFEPFYTTKERGKGTGLGLSTVYGIVRQSGGFVRVTSRPGGGTTFRIFLPEAEAAEERAPVPAEPAAAPTSRGSETVLLVEDDPLVRRVTARTLRSAGYAVVEATDGSDALRVAAEGPAPDLLVTDLVMPHMGGEALAARFRADHPDARVLLISGYTDHGIDPRALGDDVAFLQKPFPPAALARKVRELLDRALPAAAPRRVEGA